MLVVEILCCPHLVLADAGANNRLTLRNLIQTFHDVVRLNEVTTPVVIQGMILFQCGHVVQPW